MFSSLLGPVMEKYLDHYKQVMYFESVLPGDENWAHIELDYRNTQDPIIREDSMDFFIIGEMYYNKKWDW